ncbi:hypothetical protein HJG60_008950 [Phyllostomus discolor]|uniref:Uncharacterized protein n=1 Tax=Phyllostomus discolor TaxID=89673 RepID=A0A833YWU4_9CHIR|nr:hypothetical protein HJG60_008950 [Phyllostomus discolor]
MDYPRPPPRGRGASPRHQPELLSLFPCHLPSDHGATDRCLNMPWTFAYLAHDGLPKLPSHGNYPRPPSMPNTSADAYLGSLPGVPPIHTTSKAKDRSSHHPSRETESSGTLPGTESSQCLTDAG